MGINFTLVGQMISFMLLVWFTMKYIWPPILQGLHEREQRIADGLASAEHAKQTLELAKQEAATHVSQAKMKAAEIVEHANKRANQIIEDSKIRVHEENERLRLLAYADIEQERQIAKQKLREEAAQLAVFGAEKILMHSVNHLIQQDLVEKFIAEM